MYIENSCSDYDGTIAVSHSDSDELSASLEVNSAWKASRAFGCLAILIGGLSWMYLCYHIYYYQYYKPSSDASESDNNDTSDDDEEDEHKRRWISEEITQARIIGGIFFVAAFYQGLTLFFLRSSICNTETSDGSELRQQIGSSAEIIFGTNCSMS